MQNDIQYRWSISTPNVYNFLFNEFAGTVSQCQQRVSGIVRKSNLHKLESSLISHGFSFRDKNIRLIKAATYMKNWSKYNH